MWCQIEEQSKNILHYIIRAVVGFQCRNIPAQNHFCADNMSTARPIFPFNDQVRFSEIYNTEQT